MSRRIKTNYSYKGWNITLVMTLEGYMWTCQYIMRRSGRTVMDGFPGSTYLSREEAGETALSTAKGVIDQCQEPARYLPEVMSRWNLKPAPLVTRL
jgi:hypothetical protein